ncbi:HD domain-containing protein [Patescibacteria group bacterium]
MLKVTVKDLENDDITKAYVEKANEYLNILGYTSHGLRHVRLASDIARNILLRLGYSDDEAELAAVASFLHDTGNVCGRDHHEQTGALMSKDILTRLGLQDKYIAEVMLAIGNHEERTGDPVSIVSAATILADKTDVHRSRVQTKDPLDFDIHDKVNYAVTRSFLNVDKDNRTITLELTIDTNVAGIVEYFEIFLDRMKMSQKAARFLRTKFELDINGTKLM